MSQIRERVRRVVSGEATEPTISTTETAPEGGKGNEATGDLQKIAEMVKEALKEKEPQAYRELAQSGNLEQFAAERAEEMKEAAAALHYEMVEKTKLATKEKKNPIEMAAMCNMALHQADEYVLATYLEFPTSPQDQRV